MKKSLNVIALIVMLSVNVLTPISYAQESGLDNASNPSKSPFIKGDLQDSEFLIEEQDASLIKEGDVYHASMDEVVEDLSEVEGVNVEDSSLDAQNDKGNTQQPLSPAEQASSSDRESGEANWVIAEDMPAVVTGDVPSLIDIVVDTIVEDMDNNFNNEQNDEVMDSALSVSGVDEPQLETADETEQEVNGSIVYEDGIIKISYGEHKIWLTDKNVGAKNSAMTPEAYQLMQLANQMCRGTYQDELASINVAATAAPGISYVCDDGFATTATAIAGVEINTYNDAMNYISSHYDTSPNAYGDYYRWGNDGYVNYDELSCQAIEDEQSVESLNNDCYLDILNDAVERGFMSGYNQDNYGWSEGYYDNPCDVSKGEYLPAPSDREQLIDIWGNIYEIPTQVANSLGSRRIDSSYVSQFMSDLMIPNAGYVGIFVQPKAASTVNGNPLIYNNYSDYLWTASGYDSAYGQTAGKISMNSEYGVEYYDGIDGKATPIRCFVAMNPVTVTFNISDTESVEYKVESGKTIAPMIPERDGYYFLGWYENQNHEGDKFDFSYPITEDIALYAKWGWIIYDDGGITYTDTNGNIFDGIGTITFTDGVKSITMLDRNLGAQAKLGDSEGDSNGYYFQWGNNYGFLPGENEIDLERVDVTGYGRNNPYVSEKFIVNTGQWNYSELSENDEEEYADGLWGGVGDYRDNTWDSSEGHDYMRQGPCPDGYHVPSGGEIIELVSLRSNANNVTTTPNDKLAINISRYSGFYDFLDDFRLPLNGRIDYNISLQPTIGGDTEESFKENLKLKNSNKFTYFWSSSPYYLTDNLSHEELYGKSRRLSIGPNAKAHGSIERSNGFPVRCFADNYAEGDEPLVLSYDTRGGSAIQAQTIPEGENEYLPGYTTHRTGYELLGWYDDQGKLELDGNKITNRTMESDSSEDGVVTIYARWSDDHVVTFKDYDGRIIKVVLVRNGANAQSPANPTREGYKFTGWDKDLNNVTEDMEVTAQYSSSSNGGYSGGGGSSSKPDKSHNAADDKEISDAKDLSQKVEEQPSQGKTLDTTNPSKEIFNAHQWAYSYGLTKYRTAGEARMDDPLNRSEMAKISSIFATQFLDKVPNEKKKEFCSQYPDLWKVTSDMEAFIIESCELGYMGYESNGIDALARFRPYTPVTVAEAATILSRIVRGNDNAMNGKDWYKGHLYATYNHGLIDDIQDPTKRSITRREAYLMLYRLIKDK